MTRLQALRSPRSPRPGSRPGLAAGWVGLAAVGLLLTACGDETKLTAVQPQLTVVELLDLGEVVVGQKASGGLVLTNSGRAPLKILGFDLDEPRFVFAAQPPAKLGPGAAVTLDLSITPTAIGQIEGAVQIRSDDPDRPEVTVRLRVRASPIPTCDDGNACTADRYDPDQDACVHSYLDDTPCESKDRCIQNARCNLGVCVGASKVCDDGVDCTQDVCRQSDGECVYLPRPSICEDKNPCTTDTCTATGCTNEPLANGAACDDQDDCTTGDACVAGACTGASGAVGASCDDHDNCTTGDVCTAEGRCQGTSIITGRAEGAELFGYDLEASHPEIPSRKFLHRRHVSMGDDGTFFGLDHLVEGDDSVDSNDFIHRIFAFEGCGKERYAFDYRPSDHLYVSYVRRSLQLSKDNALRVAVGVRTTKEDGWQPFTTTYLLDPQGNPTTHAKEAAGGETGRALLPDGSYVYGVVMATNSSSDPETATQNLVIVRQDRFGSILWRYDVKTGPWAELLGVAGPRVLFWANKRFSALDFNTGARVWSQPTTVTSKEMALSTELNLGLVRADQQIVAVELLTGKEVFRYPKVPSPQYRPFADPVIAPDGRILTVMIRRDPVFPASDEGASFDWLELDQTGAVKVESTLPYTYPDDNYRRARAEDWSDNSSITVAEDGIGYFGIGTIFMAINTDGVVRWSRQRADISNAYTATVPLLRKDGVLLINEGSRRVVGIKTNGAVVSDRGWGSYRHDARRTNYTP